MNRHANGFGGLAPAHRFPELTVTISAAANERYWRPAGVDHELLRDGALYPPIVANLTVLLVQQTVPIALLHTEQRTTSLGRATAGATVTVRGSVVDAFERRGRDYVVVDAVASVDDAPLWRSVATFTPTGATPRPAPSGEAAPRTARRARTEPLPADAVVRPWHLDAESLRAYSRSGNFHSDPDEARRLGLPGLVAQGMQVCGPAYGVLLDAWGAELLDHGRLDARFVGMVVDGQTVTARVALDGGHARFEVHDDRDRLVALGDAAMRH